LAYIRQLTGKWAWIKAMFNIENGKEIERVKKLYTNNKIYAFVDIDTLKNLKGTIIFLQLGKSENIGKMKSK